MKTIKSLVIIAATVGFALSAFANPQTPASHEKAQHKTAQAKQEHKPEIKNHQETKTNPHRK